MNLFNRPLSVYWMIKNNNRANAKTRNLFQISYITKKDICKKLKQDFIGII